MKEYMLVYVKHTQLSTNCYTCITLVLWVDTMVAY